MYSGLGSPRPVSNVVSTIKKTYKNVQATYTDLHSSRNNQLKSRIAIWLIKINFRIRIGSSMEKNS
jgi:hypothetical protein